MQTIKFKFLISHNDFCFDRGGVDANCVTPSSYYRIPGRLLCPDRKFSNLLHLNRAVHRAIIGNYLIQKTESVERGGSAQHIFAGNQPASQQSVTRIACTMHYRVSIAVWSPTGQQTHIPVPAARRGPASTGKAAREQPERPMPSPHPLAGRRPAQGSAEPKSNTVMPRPPRALSSPRAGRCSRPHRRR